jgi:hypothetical protein
VWDLGKSQIISNTSYFHRKQLTAYQGTVYDLSYWQTIPSALGGPDESPQPPKCSAPDDATSCSWFPLLNADGIHLPAALRGTQTPNIMTNKQESYTQELRWQSNDPASKWNWTAGIFWQLAKEGSVEELRSTNIDSVFNYLFGLSPTDFYGATLYSCPTNVAYPSIPACDIYYNSNTTFDRQIAAFGEVSYAFTDWMRLTVGERVARTSFSLDHYADGYENYGPDPARFTRGGGDLEYAQGDSCLPGQPTEPVLRELRKRIPGRRWQRTPAGLLQRGSGECRLPEWCPTDLQVRLHTKLRDRLEERL